MNIALHTKAHAAPAICGEILAADSSVLNNALRWRHGALRRVAKAPHRGRSLGSDGAHPHYLALRAAGEWRSMLLAGLGVK